MSSNNIKCNTTLNAKNIVANYKIAPILFGQDSNLDQFRPNFYFNQLLLSLETIIIYITS